MLRKESYLQWTCRLCYCYLAINAGKYSVEGFLISNVQEILKDGVWSVTVTCGMTVNTQRQS